MTRTGVFRFLLGLYSVLFSHLAIAQLENSKWIFGHFAGFDFSTAPPTPIIDAWLSSAEACASVSDGQGNLLFYTNGDKVWNAKHLLMQNGVLMGHNSASQGALIVKQPGTSSIYFVFTLDAQYGVNGWRYSVVDMSQLLGLGAVTQKDIFICTSASEKMTGTAHCNGIDTWVVAHDSTNQFMAVLVSAAGVNTVPVISNAGLSYGHYGWAGYLRFRPDGEKLVAATRWLDSTSTTVTGGFEMFDFNTATGIVSNAVLLAKGYPYGEAYSCEFSASGRYLYGSIGANISPKIIWQWDMCGANIDSIRNSQFAVANYSLTNAIPYGLARAIDDRIYVAALSATLGVINDPDSAKSSCNFSSQGLIHPYAGAICGLPNIIYPSAKHDFFYTTSCNAASFSCPNIYKSGCLKEPVIGQMLWNFGDPASGTSNFSTQQNPVHYFSNNGTYTVELILQKACSTDTIKKIVQVTGLPPLTVSGPQQLCAGESQKYSVAGANSYSWSNGVTTSSTVLAPTVTTTYSVSGTSTISGCSTSKIFTVSVLPCSSVEELERPTVILYPNPAQNLLNLELNNDADMILYNQLGVLLLSLKLKLGVNTVDLTGLEDGLYFITVTRKNQTSTIKFLKQS